MISFFQIELIQPIWQNAIKLRKSLNVFLEMNFFKIYLVDHENVS